MNESEKVEPNNVQHPIERIGGLVAHNALTPHHGPTNQNALIAYSGNHYWNFWVGLIMNATYESLTYSKWGQLAIDGALNSNKWKHIATNRAVNDNK